MTATKLDDDAFVTGLGAAGLPPEVAGLLASSGAAIRDGHLDQRSEVVRELTGRPARTVAEVLSGRV